MLCVRGLCLPAHLDVLMMWVEEEGIIALTFKITLVWSREGDTDSTAMNIIILCATASKLGSVSISLHRGMRGEDWDKSPSKLEVWKMLSSQLPICWSPIKRLGDGVPWDPWAVWEVDGSNLKEIKISVLHRNTHSDLLLGKSGTSPRLL